MNNLYKNIFSFISLALFCAFGAGLTRAQTTETPTIPMEQVITRQVADDIGLNDLSAPVVDIIVSSSGTIGNTAILKAKTDNINANSALFEWYLDDKLAVSQSGRSKMEFSFRTTKIFHIVRLVISENGQKLTENTVSVASFNVVLTWHTDTFVPADYEGKAIPSVGSRVTVVATPEIRDEKPDDLLYTWYIDAESEIRGAIGEQEFSFNIRKNVNFVSVIVEVSTQSQSIMVREAINVPVIRPFLVIYNSAEKENGGLPKGSIALKPSDKTYFYAQPFYFHINSLDDLTYEWNFAGYSVLGAPPDPNLLTLTIPKDSGTGARILQVGASNPALLGEDAGARVEIRITQPET